MDALVPSADPASGFSRKGSHLHGYFMASPQLENGFARIANETLEALGKFPMGGPQFRVIHWLFRKTYGWGEDACAGIRLNMAEIGRGIDMERTNVRRAVLSLVEMNVVFIKGRKFSFNKDHETWNVIKLITNNNVIKRTTQCDQLDHTMESNGSQKCDQTDPPYKERKKLLKETLKERDFEIPEWLDKTTWEQFLQHRKSLKAAMTEHAKSLAVKKLEKFKNEGQDPTEIIERSILNGWKGLFPLDERDGDTAKLKLKQATDAAWERRHGKSD